VACRRRKRAAHVDYIPAFSGVDGLRRPLPRVVFWAVVSRSPNLAATAVQSLIVIVMVGALANGYEGLMLVVVAVELAAWRILGADLPNYSGAVAEMRDTISLVLHRLAPDDDVVPSEGFVLESGQKRPTGRQRARHIALKRTLGSELTKSLVGDSATSSLPPASIAPLPPHRCEHRCDPFTARHQSFQRSHRSKTRSSQPSARTGRSPCSRSAARKARRRSPLRS
jgi:hypothetical protein